jgi:hypothetical protein
MATAQQTTTEMSLFTLGHHVGIARQRYLEDAKVMDEAGLTHVGDYFRRMADECGQWAEALQYGEVRKITYHAGGESMYVHHQDWDSL